MPADGRQLVLAVRAELITAVDPDYRGIDADAHLPHWINVRPLTPTSPGGEHIADLAGGRGRLAHLHLHPPSRRTTDHRHRRLLGLTTGPVQRDQVPRQPTYVHAHCPPSSRGLSIDGLTFGGNIIVLQTSGATNRFEQQMMCFCSACTGLAL
ncbi:hypothetical protein [Streptomyces sp. NPDC008121]|uniref:hypothetical protein n=1 Tax=Streptomyces sp. NPDC008121 TaxID=3364809 RepID=UPI0036E498D7